MDKIEEFRYPFESVFEFFSGGYWINIQGWHLTFGWLVLLLLSLRVFSRKSSLSLKLITIYFAAFIFNNYAYSFASVSVSELCGIFAAILSLRTNNKFRLF